MNSVVLALTVGLAGLTSASSVNVRRQDTPAPRVETPGRGGSADRGIQPDRRQGPFEKLFTPPQAPRRPEAPPVNAPEGASKTQKPRVVCGMVVIPVDPALDPHIVIRPKEHPGSARIRRIPATTCVD